MSDKTATDETKDQAVDTKTESKKERKTFMVDWVRNRGLATLLHDVSCTWGDGTNACGYMGDCEWLLEEQEEHPWAQPAHSHFVEVAEDVMKHHKDDPYIEDLIRLHETCVNLIKVISNTVYRLCDNAEINHHGHTQ